MNVRTQDKGIDGILDSDTRIIRSYEVLRPFQRKIENGEMREGERIVVVGDDFAKVYTITCEDRSARLSAWRLVDDLNNSYTVRDVLRGSMWCRVNDP